MHSTPTPPWVATGPAIPCGKAPAKARVSGALLPWAGSTERTSREAGIAPVSRTVRPQADHCEAGSLVVGTSPRGNGIRPLLDYLNDGP